MFNLIAANCPDTETGFKNVVAISNDDFNRLGASNPIYITLGEVPFIATAHPLVEKGRVGLNKVQRSYLQVSLGDQLSCSVYKDVGTQFALSSVTVEIDFMLRVKSNESSESFDGKKIVEILLQRFVPQVWSKGQKILLEAFGSNLILTIANLALVAPEEDSDEKDKRDQNPTKGLLTKGTHIQLQPASGSPLKLTNVDRAPSSLLGTNFNFESMGIGGLDKEFAQIFRRAFASRTFPADFVKKLGINHVRGMLLFGPPGTGKTLIARQIGKMLNCRPPKIVTGPEVLNKYVGQSEENIRNLFADAEAEYKEKGDDSQLHIIIMDEIDSICKQRGTGRDGTGVHDTVVNQLLAKIDGVDSLNNILLIGMTNRKDMIDEALLRPGRLEVHVEIGLPDEPGRLQIIKIHTAKARENGKLADDVDLPYLAASTKNFSGAEIEGLVKSATACALTRHINTRDLSKPVETNNLQITQSDFDFALTEVRPAFGVSTESFDQALSGGFIFYGPQMTQLHKDGQLLIKQLISSNKTSVLTVLLHGSRGCGKTAFALKLAQENQFPFIKLISPEKYIGYTELSKIQAIQKVFDDAYRSPLSAIIVDDIEILLEYVPIGPRFSNGVLQCLKVLLKMAPPKGRKLFIFGTTSSRSFLEELQLSDAFTSLLEIPKLVDARAIQNVIMETKLFSDADAKSCAEIVSQMDGGIEIKKLLVLCELAKQDSGLATMEAFKECLRLV
eukprot:c19331_g1_i1.p1 GENE.c19331_g1_i1~~c19331_g1_i1.p1  ORF type:complete len:730 (-),score=327.15 c19331_g1_i1:29-2218(-)